MPELKATDQRLHKIVSSISRKFWKWTFSRWL